MDLVYTIYIGRYTKEVLNLEPDFSKLDCSEIDGRLNASTYYAFYVHACLEGWINSTLTFTHDLDLELKFGPRTLQYVHLPSMKEYGVLPEYTKQDLDVKGHVTRSQLQTYYTSIIAYLVVERYRQSTTGVRASEWRRPMINLVSELFSQRYNFSTVLHIANYKEVQDTVILPIARYTGKNLHYYTYDNWVFDNLEKGNYRTKGYTYDEKLQHLNETKYYQPGLPVFKYEKAVNLTAGKISGLKNVHICVIQEIKPREIVMNKTSIVGTKEDLALEKEQNQHLEEIFVIDNNLGAVNQRIETLDYSLLGVDVVMMGTMRQWLQKAKDIEENFLDEMFEEKYFIRGVGDQLTTELHITRPELPAVFTKEHKYFKIQLTYADAVYWLLDDHGIDFDRELFKEVYKDYLQFDIPLAEMSTPELIKTLLKSQVTANMNAGISMSNQYIEYLNNKKEGTEQ